MTAVTISSCCPRGEKQGWYAKPCRSCGWHFWLSVLSIQPAEFSRDREKVSFASPLCPGLSFVAVLHYIPPRINIAYEEKKQMGFLFWCPRRFKREKVELSYMTSKAMGSIWWQQCCHTGAVLASTVPMSHNDNKIAGSLQLSQLPSEHHCFEVRCSAGACDIREFEKGRRKSSLRRMKCSCPWEGWVVGRRACQPRE